MNASIRPSAESAGETAESAKFVTGTQSAVLAAAGAAEGRDR